jgi:ParB-like chromosome segregation protein Spo0J
MAAGPTGAGSGTMVRTTREGNMETRELLELIREHVEAPTLEATVERLNELRRGIHELSPFRNEPVDYVEWVPADRVIANDYNPNAVAPPEMELLELSITADGYTQPIVSLPNGDDREVVDGFHRHRVGKESAEVAERIMGYLPLVSIRADREGKADRIAATIRHNRARGKHQVLAMSDIVLELKRRNWSDDKIGRELGMDPDEVLRLAQITGMAEAFKDRDFSEAWEPVLDVDDYRQADPMEQL